MSKLISVPILALLTIALSSAIPRNDEPKKKEGITTPPGVLVRTLPTIELEGDDQASINEEDKDEVNLMEIMNECNETFVIQMSYMLALNDSGSFPDETDRNPKCYIRCVLEKTGVTSEEGVFDPARAAMVYAGERGGRPMDDVQIMATECGYNRVEPCKCERSYQFMKCLMEMEIQHYEKSSQGERRM